MLNRQCPDVCVWLRLFEMTDDLRYLNAALKMNEMLKRLTSIAGRGGIDGGVSGSYPVWGATSHCVT